MNEKCPETYPSSLGLSGPTQMKTEMQVIIRMGVGERTKLLKSYLTFLLPWAYFFIRMVKLIDIMGSGVFL